MSDLNLKKWASDGIDAAEAVGVARLCGDWLDGEEQFHQALGELLSDLSTQSPFVEGTGAEVQTRLEQLAREREELRKQQIGCRIAIARLRDCPVKDAHLSLLEAVLPQDEQQPLRGQCLRMTSLWETTRQRMRTTEMRLSRHNTCATEILAVVLGQPSSPVGYGADGRQSTGSPVGTLQAVS